MNVINYQKVLDQTIARLSSENQVPRLLLHSCCAPCSSYCLEYLSEYFDITVYFYNPNITEQEEYEKRVAEIKRLISELPAKHPIHFLEGPYDPEHFFEMSEGLETVPEGGSRCFKCYEMRLKMSAEAAVQDGFDYFTTTLSISPLKNAAKLNEIGKQISDACGVSYLYSDFKKKNGYKRSIELSAQYHLYRQNYCGCVYSKAAREAQLVLQSEI